eukprot:TRINITY_DN97_c0_g1_i1.p1 TRINITY_DN97_c0_g1~~TRINITY_DN97_c0_g1_i1.p1  ORF type:complete len:244 (-),score=51.60 TRINITY_DN97_c0_g1_i1:125-856(-)
MQPGQAVNVVNGVVTTNQATGIHGSDPRMSQGGEKILARAEFQDFAPACCVCCSCCVRDIVRKRMYAFVGENRLEMNIPIGTCGCLTSSDYCVFDRIFVYYFDKQPHRSATCTCCSFPTCIPLTCCGPPVIYGKRGCECCCGESLLAAQHNCCGCKRCLCCGSPCYEDCGFPLLTGLKNTQQFLAVYKMAFNNYRAKHALDESTTAIFEIEGGNVGCAQQAVMMPMAPVNQVQVVPMHAPGQP